jgi:hypothetical protein
VYYYTLATRFLDKYGNRTAVSYFEPGRVITVGEKDDQGKVTQVQISDAVWEYPDVSRYSVDMDRGIFKIGDERYSPVSYCSFEQFFTHLIIPQTVYTVK